MSDAPPAAPSPARTDRPAPLPRAALPPGAWRGEVVVRFSHCDPAGIVYFARYFDVLNGAVEDWFSQALGLSYADFIGPRRIGLGYAHAEADFARPARMGDRLALALLVERVGRGSIELRAHAWRGEEGVLTARLVIATTDLAAHRTIPVPDDLRAALERYREACR